VAEFARRHQLGPDAEEELATLVERVPTELLGTDEDEAPPVAATEQAFVHARYEDRGPLSAGGMGEVRRGFDRLLLREVAVKLIRRDRMDHESQLAGVNTRPNTSWSSVERSGTYA